MYIADQRRISAGGQALQGDSTYSGRANFGAIWSVFSWKGQPMIGGRYPLCMLLIN